MNDAVGADVWSQPVISGLDEDIIWDVIENETPPLREAVAQALTSLG